MSKIIENYHKLIAEIDPLLENNIKLVVVSKKQSLENIEELYKTGVRDFGENKVVEALLKMESLPKDINWHLIGPLQKNKVRKAIGKFVLIHSVDSYDLAKKISDVSKEMNSVTSILMQVNTTGELSKQGLSIDECHSQFKNFFILPNIQIKGFMTMAPFTEDQDLIRCAFNKLKSLLERINKDYQLTPPLKELSMGMTNDYQIAIEEGATLLRIGSYIFQPL